MSASLLTPKAIPRILSGENVINPRLQVLGYKKVGDTTSSEENLRYRFLLSDGAETHQFCVMMGPKLIRRIELGEFEKFSIIELRNYALNGLNERQVIIIMEPLLIKKGTEVKERICTGSSRPADSSFSELSERKIAVPQRPSLKTPVRSSGLPRQDTPSHSRNTGAAGSSDVSQFICSIGDLNPYRHLWAIKGRVTAKSQIRTWNNQKGEGKLFSFDMSDDTGEIRVTAFKAECDKFFDMIEVGKVFVVGKATIKTANKKFSQLNCDYEISLGSDSQVYPGNENDSDCPKLSYNFVKINDLAEKDPDSLVDIIGICRSVGDLQMLTSKNSGREFKKRDISLVDDTETEVKLTLWGDQAEQNSASEGSAVVVKKAKVSDFNGRSLSCIQSSFVQIDPEMPTAFGLKGWYERAGRICTPKSLSVNSNGASDLSQWRSLCELNHAEIRSANGVLNCTTVATVVQVGKLSDYMSCPTPGCKKKVEDMNNGTYNCEKCNKRFAEYEQRMILNLAISDWGAETWISVFNEDAEKILGHSARELLQLKEDNNPEYEEIISSLNFKRFSFRLRAVEQQYKEEIRVRVTASNISAISSSEYGRKLLEKLSLLSI